MLMFFIATANAQATTAATPQQSPMMSMVPFVLVFIVMYFFMIKPQKKRAQEEQDFLNKLAHGDEIFTKSGIMGKITGITEKIVTIEVSENVKMKVLKTHLGGLSKSILNPSPEKK